ncbi:MAG: NUDIX domain-containing protein [Acidimicrobiales bacterium]
MRAGGIGDPLSGDGFVRAADGGLRWGRYGAAGLLVRHVHTVTGVDSYFVALRSQHTHMGGTWAIPGGALAYRETPVEAALREFREEVGLTLSPDQVVQIHEDDHGGWVYWTVLLDVDEPFPLPTTVNWETADVRWVRKDELYDLPLLEPFRATMVRLGVLSR